MTLTKTKKHIILGLFFVLMTLVMMQSVYNVIDRKDPTRFRTRQDYVLDIETPGKKLLNGHLGVFFRFKYLGNIHWLIIPLLIWFFFSKRVKKERWQLAVIFSWFALLVFIGFKGYANARYQLTFVPFNAILLLNLMWKFLEDKTRGVRIIALALVTLVCTFNIYHYFDIYKNYWNMRVTVNRPHFPYKIIDFMRNSGELTHTSKVYAINQPIYFYYVHQTGVDHRDPYMAHIWRELIRKFGGSRQDIYQQFTNIHGIKFILLRNMQKRFFRPYLLEEFLECECHLEIEEKGWLLYRLRERSLEKTIKQPGFKNFNVWNRKGEEVKVLSPQLIRLSRRGIYRYDVVKNSKRNILTVRNTISKKRIKKRVHFGYEFDAHSLGEDIPRGKYIHFIVRTAISPRLVNINNCIILADRDKNKKWQQSKTVFTTHHWRTYIVSKKIREDADRVIIYFRFSPKSPQDIFKVSDVKIVVSEKPL